MWLTPKDQELVLASRASLKAMRDDPEGCGKVPGTRRSCALCGEYNTGSSHCMMCPVMIVTRDTGCMGTPSSETVFRYREMMRADRESDEHRLATAAYQEATQKFIDWIDKHLLAEDDVVQCPKCGSKDISLHMSFKDNLAGCRACRHEWVIDTALADDQQLPSEVTRAAERAEGEES